MDINKVIATSLDKSVKDITNGKIDEVLNLDDEQLQKAVQQNQLLMNYSITLLKTYHEELRKELATHGIEISLTNKHIRKLILLLKRTASCPKWSFSFLPFSLNPSPFFCQRSYPYCVHIRTSDKGFQFSNVNYAF